MCFSSYYIVHYFITPDRILTLRVTVREKKEKLFVLIKIYLLLITITYLLVEIYKIII